MKDKELQRIIEYHYRLQYGCFFSELIGFEGSLYASNDLMDCFIWNHVFPFGEGYILNEVIKVSEKYFSTRKRKSCVYLDESNNTTQNKLLLETSGYRCVDNEAWLMYPTRKNIEERAFELDLAEVSKNSDLDAFCSICTECFGEQYSVAIEREYNRFQVHKKVSHFVFSKNKVIVGIGSLYSCDEYVFIHNIGVKEQYRKNGFANAIMHYLISKAFSVSSETVKLVLQCDGGGFIEDMYLKLGFENIYRRWGYLKE